MLRCNTIPAWPEISFFRSSSPSRSAFSRIPFSTSVIFFSKGFIFLVLWGSICTLNVLFSEPYGYTTPKCLLFPFAVSFFWIFGGPLVHPPISDQKAHYFLVFIFYLFSPTCFGCFTQLPILGELGDCQFSPLSAIVLLAVSVPFSPITPFLYYIQRCAGLVSPS